MVGDKKTLKFQMMMAPLEAEVLDDWMFKNRVRSRAEAIRRLCQIGMIFDRDADTLGQQAFQLFLVTMDLAEKYEARRSQFLPTDELEIDPLTQAVIELMDRVSLLVADFEATANMTLPYRTAPDLDTAAREAATAKVEAANLRDKLTEGMIDRPKSVLDDAPGEEDKKP